MKVSEKLCGLVLTVILLGSPLATQAKQDGTQPVAAPTDVATVAAPVSVQLLPDQLAGVRATSDVKKVDLDSLAEVVGDKAPAYREYLLVGVASRTYGTARIDLFQVENAFAAFGLFKYSADVLGATAFEKGIGADSAAGPGELVFWKDHFVVRVSNLDSRKGESPLKISLANAVAESLGPDTEVNRPPLLSSLPTDAAIEHSKRYFLGPESLSAYIQGGREMFNFSGRAEAVLAEYRPSNPLSSTIEPGQGNGPATNPKSPGTAGHGSPIRLVIVEYHTPNFATDALARVNEYISSLPQGLQDRLLVKREGNFIVSAIDFSNREFAEQLVESVKYPYTVKWLRNPLWPTNDPWRAQKAAQMLLSTFGILGLMLAGVLVVGGTFGTLVFLKRRKRQREIFSDAGGMLRLDLDPFDATILGLPPGDERG